MAFPHTSGKNNAGTSAGLHNIPVAAPTDLYTRSHGPNGSGDAIRRLGFRFELVQGDI